MKLHEIIKTLENPESSVLIEVMQPYFKSLRAYYSAYGTRFNSELILMVTSVTNATAYARIEPANEFSEALEQYIDTMELETEEDKQHARELIGCQSIFLNQLINKQEQKIINNLPAQEWRENSVLLTRKLNRINNK